MGMCFLFSQVTLVLDDCHILSSLISHFRNTSCVVIAHITFDISHCFLLRSQWAKTSLNRQYKESKDRDQKDKED